MVLSLTQEPAAASAAGRKFFATATRWLFLHNCVLDGTCYAKLRSLLKFYPPVIRVTEAPGVVYETTPDVNAIATEDYNVEASTAGWIWYLAREMRDTFISPTAPLNLRCTEIRNARCVLFFSGGSIRHYTIRRKRTNRNTVGNTPNCSRLHVEVQLPRNSGSSSGSDSAL